MNLDEITKYCGDVRERIRACRYRPVAEMLKERLCDELSLNCHSELIQSELLRYIDDLIIETFDEQGNNKFLEEK